MEEGDEVFGTVAKKLPPRVVAVADAAVVAAADFVVAAAVVVAAVAVVAAAEVVVAWVEVEREWSDEDCVRPEGPPHLRERNA